MDETNYELTCLVSPDLNENELKETLKIIESHKGAKEKEEPRKIRLSYPINKKTEAFICVYEINALPEEIKEFQEKIKKEKRIIRFLLIKKRKEKQIKETPKKKKAKKVELNKVDEKLGEILK